MLLTLEWEVKFHTPTKQRLKLRFFVVQSQVLQGRRKRKKIILEVMHPKGQKVPISAVT
jgi:hypothetical protein